MTTNLVREIRGRHHVIDHERACVEKDYVQPPVSLPPRVTISRTCLATRAAVSELYAAVAVRALKGKTAHHLLAEFAYLKKRFWGQRLWARGCFCCSSGNVTDDVIAKNIAERNIEPDEDFKADG